MSDLHSRLLFLAKEYDDLLEYSKKEIRRIALMDDIEDMKIHCAEVYHDLSQTPSSKDLQESEKVGAK